MRNPTMTMNVYDGVEEERVEDRKHRQSLAEDQRLQLCVVSVKSITTTRTTTMEKPCEYPASTASNFHQLYDGSLYLTRSIFDLDVDAIERSCTTGRIKGDLKTGRLNMSKVFEMFETWCQKRWRRNMPTLTFSISVENVSRMECPFEPERLPSSGSPLPSSSARRLASSTKLACDIFQILPAGSALNGAINAVLLAGLLD